jgi:hypothetical protein
MKFQNVGLFLVVFAISTSSAWAAQPADAPSKIECTNGAYMIRMTGDLLMESSKFTMSVNEGNLSDDLRGIVKKANFETTLLNKGGQTPSEYVFQSQDSKFSIRLLMNVETLAFDLLPKSAAPTEEPLTPTLGFLTGDFKIVKLRNAQFICLMAR